MEHPATHSQGYTGERAEASRHAMARQPAGRASWISRLAGAVCLPRPAITTSLVVAAVSGGWAVNGHREPMGAGRGGGGPMYFAGGAISLPRSCSLATSRARVCTVRTGRPV